jgi:hypothetical protein
MIYLTVRNKDGNHGHQLYDLIGGLTIAKIFGFRYVHTPYPYLEFANVGYGETPTTLLPNIPEISFCGLTKHGEGLTIKEAQSIFIPISKRVDETLLVVLSGIKYRIIPCKTIQWYKDGLLDKDVFSELVGELSDKYWAGRTKPKKDGVVRIAAHIDRGKGPKDPWKSRYVLPMAYFERIFEQIEWVLGDREHEITIYAEDGYSAGVPERFQNRRNTKIHHGPNRWAKDFPACEYIFHKFVECDILITCGSAFSTVATHFRQGRPTIYHPHCLLYNLPESNFYATKLDGSFDWERGFEI